MAYPLQILVNMSFSFFATFGFALTINIPRRALLLCGVSGMSGWMTYWWLMQLGTGRMIANLSGAFIIGILGIVFSRVRKMPIIIFNIPGIVPLVPGAPAFQAVRAIVDGDIDNALRLTMKVGIVISAIALGFMLAQLVSVLTTRISNNKKKRQMEKTL